MRGQVKVEQQVAQAHITPNAAWMNIAKGGQGQGWGSNLYDVHIVIEFLGTLPLEISSREINQMITLSSNALCRTTDQRGGLDEGTLA